MEIGTEEFRHTLVEPQKADVCDQSERLDCSMLRRVHAGRWGPLHRQAHRCE